MSFQASSTRRQRLNVSSAGGQLAVRVVAFKSFVREQLTTAPAKPFNDCVSEDDRLCRLAGYVM